MPDHTHTEIELKLRLLTTDAWSNVFASPALVGLTPPLPRDERLEAWYFDSHDRKLQQAGIAYRIRLENGRWIATVKAGGTSAGGLHKRLEWNVEVPEPQPDISYFQETEAGPLLQDALGDTPLVMLFSTAFDRRITELTAADGSIIELAVDRGLIISGERQEPIAELELELKQGNPAAVLELGTELAKSVPMTVEPRSKFFRGLRLAGLIATETPDLPTETVQLTAPVDDALPQLVIDQIHGVFAAQEYFLHGWQDAEKMHQLRIQLRRLRSLISFGKPLINQEEYQHWQNELKNLGSLMAYLRELDVILEVWQELTVQSSPIPEPAPWLGLMLQAERNKLVKELADTLGQGQSTPLLLGLWSFFAKQPFTISSETTSLAQFSSSRLSGWINDIRELGQNLTLDNLADLHQSRIQSKKIRYVLESLQLRDHKTKLLLSRLKKLQDCLGQIRDTEQIAKTMGHWMNMHASRVIHRDAGMVLGWTARLSFEEKQNYERLWRRFRKASRRWLKDADHLI